MGINYLISWDTTKQSRGKFSQYEMHILRNYKDLKQPDGTPLGRIKGKSLEVAEGRNKIKAGIKSLFQKKTMCKLKAGSSKR